ncbi:MAG: hypothetical protein ACRC5A_12800 [Enterobacteriaceae bacterium]
MKEWLSNPKRSYADGVALFEAHASEGHKDKYLKALKAGEAPAPFDPKFSTLINLITMISGSLYAGVATVDAPEKEKGEKDYTPAKVVTPDDLPDELKERYAKVRTNVPRMASIQSELENDMTDEERKKLSDELLSLDEENAEVYADIYAWCDKNHYRMTQLNQDKPKSDDADQDEVDPKEKLRRLRANLKRCEKSHAEHVAAGKTVKAENALLKIEEYKRLIVEQEAKIE